MNTAFGKETGRRGKPARRPRGGRGFTLIEILIGITILAVGLLGIAGMFSTAYVDINAGGNTTMAVTAARQIIEDMRLLPFASLDAMNPAVAGGQTFDTNNPASQPAGGAERAMARKWRFLVAGNGTGWNLKSPETDNWTSLYTGGANFGGQATVTVTTASPTLRLVTVTVPVPRRNVNVSLSTLISSL